MTPDFPAIASALFSPTGPLSRLAGYEHRPQQETMARAIAEALEMRRHLIVEAPTGVGKTLAYLVPAVMFARSQSCKAVIATHTKNLQEQIFQKDIPLARAVAGIDFRAVVLKGRRNYLCTTRLHHVLGSTAALFEREQLTQLRRIHDWSTRSPDGDVENLGFIPDTRVWDMVCSEKDVCSSSLCSHTCFFQLAKERLRSAEIVIMNHALFFSLLQLQEGNGGFIFDRDFVILDEAHMLEGVAGTALGMNLSRYRALAVIHRLYHDKTKKGLLARHPRPVRALCEEAERATREFFDHIREIAEQPSPENSRSAPAPLREVRIRTPNVIRNIVEEPLARLHAAVQRLEQGENIELRKPELAAACTAIEETGENITAFLEQSMESHAYWVECAAQGSENVAICSAPVEVAEYFKDRVFREGRTVILTSATLSVGGSLEYFRQRLGAGAVEGLTVDSPFDHARQMRIALVPDIPEPDRVGWSDRLPSKILQSIDRSRGKALVLFTSNALMQSMAQLLAAALQARGFTLLVQGGETPRHELLERFKRDIHSVLFGLESFWMGVDVPGEALEHVIITRLPFSLPTHPLTQARLERIEQRGGNAFLELSLPEAVLKFRQGLGRLLRSRTDRGIVTILDSRILTRPYGRLFLSSVPRCPIEVVTDEGGVEYMEVEP